MRVTNPIKQWLRATSFQPPLAARDRLRGWLPKIPNGTRLREREQRRDAVALPIGWLFDQQRAT